MLASCDIPATSPERITRNLMDRVQNVWRTTGEIFKSWNPGMISSAIEGFNALRKF
jgi:hypothetical protein